MLFSAMPRHSAVRLAVGAVIAVAAIAGGILVFGVPAWTGLTPSAANATPANTPQQAATDSGAPPTLELSSEQLASFKVASVGTRVFPIQDRAVGSIDFDEDMESQVFTPYQGRILGIFAKVGDDVSKGQTLFTIDSPDLIQAESTLITAAGVLQMTTRALARAKVLYTVKGLAQKDYDQAVSDQQGAEASYRAAIDAVRIFGKTQAEIDRILATHHIDSSLIVPSPITGRVTARSAAPGLFVQPGNAPAPFTVADISTMWMVANVPEIDAAAVKVGQEVKVTTLAYPGHVFAGKVTTIAATVDPTLHTLLVRSAIQDPRHELRPGMLAQFVIETGAPVTATAVPADAVVREGDGTMTVWVTKDNRHFVQRVVTLGLQHDGYDQILSGLQQGEEVVIDNAVFLDNMLATDTAG
jgi:membrane fusion protein, heavy metal efflux system